MKTELEIQRAHDVLVGAYLGESQAKIVGRTKELMAASCIALCWVLEHKECGEARKDS